MICMWEPFVRSEIFAGPQDSKEHYTIHWSETPLTAPLPPPKPKSMPGEPAKHIPALPPREQYCQLIAMCDGILNDLI